MDDPDFVVKVGVNVITEIFKTTLQGLRGSKEWLKEKERKHDPFGRAARMYSEKLEELYNSVQIFGMNRPVALRNIYTQLNILENTSAQRRVTVKELERYFDRDLRSFGTVIKTQEGVQAINGLPKSVILGKPGAGKTTFLKHLVLQALDGNLERPLVPVFVGLKEWSDSDQSLLDFIIDQFDVCDFPNAKPFVLRVLTDGNCLVLLDGFDEVNSKEVQDVVKKIKRFAAKYSKNKFVLSCRLAAYNHLLEGFIEVEIADFAPWQIEAFVNNWFGKHSPKAVSCLQALNEHRELRELASVPLLVTLLCLAFDETMAFPSNRAELYKEAIDALMKKWDSTRSIRRDEIYRHLSLRRRESLFSRIAKSTFDRNQYFIVERELESQIGEYIRNLPDSGSDSLDLDSSVVLRAIEAQHGILVERARGIHSFSHLTFQEYFTARYVVENQKDGTIKRLIDDHLLTSSNDDARWREIFLLTANMLDDADELLLLMNIRIRQFGQEKLSKLLASIESTINKHAPHSNTVSRGLLLYVLLSDHIVRSTKTKQLGGFFHDGQYYEFPQEMLNDPAHSILNESRRIVREIVRTDKQVGWESYMDTSETSRFQILQDRSFSIDKALELSALLDDSTIIDLRHYLRASSWLLECLKTECYISTKMRDDTYDSFLSIGSDGAPFERI